MLVEPMAEVLAAEEALPVVADLSAPAKNAAAAEEGLDVLRVLGFQLPGLPAGFPQAQQSFS